MGGKRGHKGDLTAENSVLEGALLLPKYLNIQKPASNSRKVASEGPLMLGPIELVLGETISITLAVFKLAPTGGKKRQSKFSPELSIDLAPGVNRKSE